MPRWLWWTPLALITLAGALFGFRMGWIAASMTETEVINKFARQYLEKAGPGAAVTDCVAYPGEIRRIWLVVSCGPKPFDPARHQEFFVNRFGGLEITQSPSSKRDVPAQFDLPET